MFFFFALNLDINISFNEQIVIFQGWRYTGVYIWRSQQSANQVWFLFLVSAWMHENRFLYFYREWRKYQRASIGSNFDDNAAFKSIIAYGNNGYAHQLNSWYKFYSILTAIAHLAFNFYNFVLILTMTHGALIVIMLYGNNLLL